MHRTTSTFLTLLCVGLFATPAFAQTRTVAPDRLPGYWNMTKSEVDGQVPNVGRKLDQPGCAAVSYMIGSDGVPRNLKARKVVPADSDFGSIAVSLVRNFRYAPSDDNTASVPVSTYYIVRFNMPSDPAARAALLAQCKLPGYDNG
ncbi:energy transducer TonB [Oleiagrimonas soli]|uniref:Uncharacterized protein n=1 Tax=Oleiagrimonas soli TaxID=1543381 RepID=A0A099CZP7_9GAMM|nr:energy transducer TonB [Oleiagrimonas soli]KGI78480.1 hypothetical protein LF63_0103080 [Oleiagrimonas soli]MBB6184270.1 hypothetical protein [Oleiagrimonas soli]